MKYAPPPTPFLPPPYTSPHTKKTRPLPDLLRHMLVEIALPNGQLRSVNRDSCAASIVNSLVSLHLLSVCLSLLSICLSIWPGLCFSLYVYLFCFLSMLSSPSARLRRWHFGAGAPARVSSARVCVCVCVCVCVNAFVNSQTNPLSVCCVRVCVCVCVTMFARWYV